MISDICLFMDDIMYRITFVAVSVVRTLTQFSQH